MNLSVALWKIDPAMTYVLNNEGDAIIEWRGPGEQPTPEQLTAAWADYLASDFGKEQQAAYTERSTRRGKETT